MADNITRCPQCHTSFRITEAHLKSAKGAVRCGSCLHIFNAREHLISAIEHQSKSATKKPLTNKPKTTAKNANQPEKADKSKRSTSEPAAVTSSPTHLTPKAQETEPKTIEETKPLIDDEDFLISDDMHTDEPDSPHSNQDDYDSDFNDDMLYNTSITAQESNLFERKKADDEDSDEEKSDDSWALALLNDEDDSLKLFKDTGQFTAVTNDTVIDEPPEDTEETFTTDFGDTGFTSGIDEKYEDMSDTELQDELEEEIRRTGYHEPVFTSADSPLEEMEAQQPDFGESTGKQYLHAIEPEPVEFSYKRDYSFFESRLLWWPLIGLMSIALLAQIAWLQFDQLNRIEPYRGYYATACKILGCKLPALVNLTEIKAVNLVVRSHPETKNALIVDAVLQNAAAFPQQFPALDLIFTNSQDKPVAARRFEPGEYLGGELAGRKEMPSRQPIHIALEIVDPGPSAVGYRIAIAH